MTMVARTDTGCIADGTERLCYALTDEEFDRIRAIIYRIAGISLSPTKKDLVYSRLARRLRARRIDSFTEYLQLLEQGDLQEWEEFINALTTNTTSFFREPHHFQILADHLAKQGKREIRIWSCAASTGEEPYSIAMTLAEMMKNSRITARILATDIDTNVLERAKQGVYTTEQVDKLDQARLKRFFLRGEGKYAGMVRIRPEIREMVTFLRLNLRHDSWPVKGKFDAIFCRNVMIYFDKPTQYAVLTKLRPYLHPDGLFFAGHSESLHHAGDLFRMRGKTVYALKS
jgi:chemotaxis protein methyltransferase CheR